MRVAPAGSTRARARGEAARVVGLLYTPKPPRVAVEGPATVEAARDRSRGASAPRNVTRIRVHAYSNGARAHTHTSAYERISDLCARKTTGTRAPRSN